jgi:signal transduction histidine kinase
MFILRKSIGATLFAAFFAMSLVIAAQGYYGYRVLSAAGDMVVDTFDHPLMAVNYGRAANFDFAQIERKLLERAHATPKARADIDLDIDDLTSTFSADLGVAEERSSEADERHEIGIIKNLVAQWMKARHAGDGAKMDSLANKIDAAFDLLIEFNTDHGFVDRRKSVAAIAEFRDVLAIGLTASFIVALLIAIFLTRRIARPLSQAADVADRIASGEFETPIPASGEDETGTLLRSMTVMQNNIRAMVARETARAASAEGRLADALETSDEGVMLVNQDGRVVVLNSRLRSFFPSIAAELVPGADYETISTLIHRQFVDTGILAPASTDEKGEHRLADGRWVRLSLSPTSENGKIVFVSDFTLIKQREESFKQAKLDAETASAAKSRFLANMSHELRTPLNAIIGFSEILTGQIFGPLGNPRYVEYSSDILGSGRHLLEVINSVLDLSKSEAGKMEIKPQAVDLSDVLADCVRMVGEQCKEAGLKLQVAGLDCEHPVFGESAKLRQVFLNLISNAIKFTESGGTVAVSAVNDGQTVVASITDSGIGMSPQDVQVALTAFGQVDNRLERRYEGTGLGLPLAKNLIELHGGSLQIESAVGQGTKVTVRLAQHMLAPVQLRSA